MVLVWLDPLRGHGAKAGLVPLSSTSGCGGDACLPTGKHEKAILSCIGNCSLNDVINETKERFTRKAHAHRDGNAKRRRINTQYKAAGAGVTTAWHT